ncbi:MAG: response regulator, partial [Bdellovibrionales bacterium]|nr:response regulator [Bdellovibrionales bacterium]
MEDNQSVTVLLVDDDEADRESIQRSFRKHKIANPLVIAENGEEALKLLRGEGSASIERPYLVLLDLNMPRMNGIQFLEALRSDSSI